MKNTKDKYGEIDWSMFKGKDINKCKKPYIKVCKLLNQNNHTLLSEYIDSQNKILIDFNCGHEPHWVLPNGYQRGSGCPTCGLKKAKDIGIKSVEISKEIIDIDSDDNIDWSKFKPKNGASGSNYNVAKNNYIKFMKVILERGDSLVGDFVNNKTSTNILLKCGHKKNIIPKRYINDSECKKCNNHNNLKEELVKIVNQNNHTLLSEYIDSHTTILIDFNCGHEPQWVFPSNYKINEKCSKCTSERNRENTRSKNEEELLKIINQNNHKLISEYKNNYTKVLIDFNCGHEPCWIKPSDYKNDQECSICNKRKLFKQRKFNFVKLVSKNNHILLSEYINANTKVLIDFNCGHNPHWITPNGYKNGKGCPLCKNKGEAALYRLLLDMGYEVERQKKYEDLKDKGLLPYDFYLPKYNLLIELDGDHHREQIMYTRKDMTDFEKDIADLDSFIRLHDRKHKDKLKDDYAIKNNIPLLRITYSKSKKEVDKWSELILDKIMEIEIEQELMNI